MGEQEDEVAASGDLQQDHFPIEAATYQQLYAYARREVRRMGRTDTLSATALVNEAWLKLAVGDMQWQSREHFFATMARVMRQFLIDHARQKATVKHGGDAMRVTLTGLDEHSSGDWKPVDLLAVDAALRKLRDLDPRLELVAELRFFGGMSIEETAAAMNLSTATIKRESRTVRAFLTVELGS